jgi:hypothetical protein
VKLKVVQLVNKFPYLLWNSKIHCFIYTSPPLEPILSQMNPVHIHIIYLRYLHRNSCIPHLRLGLSSGLLHSSFSTKIVYAFLSSWHIIKLALITLIIFCEHTYESPNDQWLFSAYYLQNLLHPRQAINVEIDKTCEIWGFHGGEDDNTVLNWIYHIYNHEARYKVPYTINVLFRSDQVSFNKQQCLSTDWTLP